MFGISSKGCYGIFAMFELALHYNKGTVNIKDIAMAQDIPQQYLEQILLKLKNAGLLKSERGASGGYKLAKSPDKITVFEILNILEGDLKLTTAASKFNVINNYFKGINTEIKILLSKNLQDLLMDNQKLSASIVYDI